MNEQSFIEGKKVFENEAAKQAKKVTPAQRRARARAQARQPERTAREVYVELQVEIGVLLASIQAGLEQHQDNVDPDAVHWGHVGDLNYIREQLQHIDDQLHHKGEYAG